MLVKRGQQWRCRSRRWCWPQVAETDFEVPNGTRCLLVELCCEEESVLSTAWMLKESHYAWRVTESVDLKRECTILSLMEAPGSLGSEVKVLLTNGYGSQRTLPKITIMTVCLSQAVWRPPSRESPAVRMCKNFSLELFLQPCE